MRIGAHMSIAGGVSKAVDRAVLHGCEALQIFTKNASQWRGKPLDPGEIRLFRERIEQTGITPVNSIAPKRSDCLALLSIPERVPRGLTRTPCV